jgi:bifunctional non-homologous end joining protein LigD
VEKPQTNEPVQWVKPKLVAQVKFAEWTAERRLRQPIFLGLRDDKKAEECTFERTGETTEIVKESKRRSKR